MLRNQNVPNRGRTFLFNNSTKAGSIYSYSSAISKQTTRLFLSHGWNFFESFLRWDGSITKIISAHSISSLPRRISAPRSIPAESTSNPSYSANMASAVGLRSWFYCKRKVISRSKLSKFILIGWNNIYFTTTRISKEGLWSATDMTIPNSNFQLRTNTKVTSVLVKGFSWLIWWMNGKCSQEQNKGFNLSKTDDISLNSVGRPPQS